jgi:hypothetical protein
MIYTLPLHSHTVSWPFVPFSRINTTIRDSIVSVAETASSASCSTNRKTIERHKYFAVIEIHTNELLYRLLLWPKHPDVSMQFDFDLISLTHQVIFGYHSRSCSTCRTINSLRAADDQCITREALEMHAQNSQQFA